MVGDRIQIEKTYSLRPQVDFRKEQAALIQKVSARVEVSRPAPQTVSQ